MLTLTAAILLFLSLLSYRPTDPSFNTVGGFGAAGRPAHNWIGLIGAWVSDLLLQIEGVTAFCLPLMVGMLGWSWLRSQTTGSPGAKAIGKGQRKAADDLCVVDPHRPLAAPFDAVQHNVRLL